MGFRSRLANGLAKLGISDSTSPSGSSHRPGTTNLNLNSLKTSFTHNPNSTQLNEMIPGFSQPVWGPEISTVGAYSREGYTTKSFDIPTVPFSIQVKAMETDEDVQYALNNLTSQITGGEHYWKGTNDIMTDYIEGFSQDIDFDWFDSILVKELLGYGNSMWKPRLGIQHIRGADDLMHLPISSYVRAWWDRQRIPYKYEFRGSEYQGYHNPQDIIPFIWNPINASLLGTGLLTTLVAPRFFEEITSNGPEDKKLPSMLDRKYSTQMTMSLAEKRYISRNVYNALDADDTERAQLQAELKNLEVAEDFVVGSKVEVQELGSQQRDFDPAKFGDLTQGAIFKGLGNFGGKQGQEASHQYANAESSKEDEEAGLASFPFAVTRQLINKLFKPWYISNPMYDMSYGGGMVGIPWDDCEYELNFGHIEKKDIELDDAIKLLETGITSGAITDPLEIRDILEQNGLQLRKEYTDAMTQQANQMAMDPYGMQGMPQQQPQPFETGVNGGGPIFDNQNAGSPPMDNAIYDDMSRNPRPTDPRLNFTEKRK